MPRKSKERAPTEWAEQIRNLRERMDISQSDLARIVSCSAMTVSRWENGQLAPTAHYYIELGKLAGKSDCWFFWELAGLQSSDVIRVLPERERKQLFSPVDVTLERAAAGTGTQQSTRPSAAQIHPNTVSIPVLDATAGTHGGRGDRRGNLHHVPAREVM